MQFREFTLVVGAPERLGMAEVEAALARQAGPSTVYVYSFVLP